MFDFGWQEFMVVAFVLVLVVGPKDLPRAFKGFTKAVGKMRGMAQEFRNSLMEAADQEELREVKQAIADTKDDLMAATKDPLEQIKAAQSSFEESVAEAKRNAPETTAKPTAKPKPKKPKKKPPPKTNKKKT